MLLRCFASLFPDTEHSSCQEMLSAMPPPKASGSALITGPLPLCIPEAGFGSKTHIVTHRETNAFVQ